MEQNQMTFDDPCDRLDSISLKSCPAVALRSYQTPRKGRPNSAKHPSNVSRLTLPDISVRRSVESPVSKHQDISDNHELEQAKEQLAKSKHRRHDYHRTTTIATQHIKKGTESDLVKNCEMTSGFAAVPPLVPSEVRIEPIIKNACSRVDKDDNNVNEADKPSKSTVLPAAVPLQQTRSSTSAYKSITGIHRKKNAQMHRPVNTSRSVHDRDTVSYTTEKPRFDKEGCRPVSALRMQKEFEGEATANRSKHTQTIGNISLLAGKAQGTGSWVMSHKQQVAIEKIRWMQHRKVDERLSLSADDNQNVTYVLPKPDRGMQDPPRKTDCTHIYPVEKQHKHANRQPPGVQTESERVRVREVRNSKLNSLVPATVRPPSSLHPASHSPVPAALHIAKDPESKKQSIRHQKGKRHKHHSSQHATFKDTTNRGVQVSLATEMTAPPRSQQGTYPASNVFAASGELSGEVSSAESPPSFSGCEVQEIGVRAQRHRRLFHEHRTKAKGNYPARRVNSKTVCSRLIDAVDGVAKSKRPPLLDVVHRKTVRRDMPVTTKRRSTKKKKKAGAPAKTTGAIARFLQQLSTDKEAIHVINRMAVMAAKNT